MRILGIMSFMMLLCLNLASATTVNLSDGNVVQGTIVKQDAKSLEISVDGVAMTYYKDEIKDIDGKSFDEAALQPAVVARPAAVQPAASEPDTVTQVEQAATPQAGIVDSDKRALILKFIDVFGTRQALVHNFDSMIKQVQKEKPDEAQKIRDRIKVDEIIDRLIPIYDRNFSSEDLQAFVNFYGSAEGQKLIRTIPLLMKESVQESIKYMKEKFPEAGAR